MAAWSGCCARKVDTHRKVGQGEYGLRAPAGGQAMRSGVGARGLMQVMPFWKKELGSPDDNLLKLKPMCVMGVRFCGIILIVIKKQIGLWRHIMVRWGEVNIPIKFSHV